MGALVTDTYLVATRKIPTAIVYNGLFCAALAKGDAAIVTTVSVLYFVVATVISVVFLGELLQMTDTAGIHLTGIAIALIMN